jgi:hypothetical protein
LIFINSDNTVITREAELLTGSQETNAVSFDVK